jgi:signal transduction histidine kinase
MGSFEAEASHVHGAPTPLKWTAFPFDVRPGETGTMLLLRDLATLRTVEAHLMDAGRFAVLTQLGAGLAHEIRNPLHSIGINAAVVEQHAGAAPTPERRMAVAESLSTIRAETQRLADLLNSYLGLVRADSSAGPVDLGDACRRVSQLLAPAARKSEVEIVLEVPDAIKAVHGFADRIQQALLNLALNAVQAMPHGGRVTLSVRPAGDSVRVTVADTGPGVPEEIRARIFEGGGTTKSGGTGLGLPLVRAIARSHGGSVSYSASATGGAVFTLELPVRPAE